MRKAFICSVIGCPNSRRRGREVVGADVKFFAFPKNESLRQQWIAAVRRDDSPLKEDASTVDARLHSWHSAKLCSEHFSDDCFDLSAQLRARFGFSSRSAKSKLKPDAVPSIFEHNKERRRNLESERRQELVTQALQSLNPPAPLKAPPSRPRVPPAPPVVPPAPPVVPPVPPVVLLVPPVVSQAPPVVPLVPPVVSPAPPVVVSRDLDSPRPLLTCSRLYVKNVGTQSNVRAALQHKTTQTCFWRKSVGMNTLPPEKTWKVRRPWGPKGFSGRTSKSPIFHHLFPQPNERNRSLNDPTGMPPTFRTSRKKISLIKPRPTVLEPVVIPKRSRKSSRLYIT
ncbi:conserved hypothetical protein [Ixodes scapularis]|uniref:THAP-type domain-containing protein n=1 Tax=Ixodes scapularis TaxID=6945 RepID=B7PBW6_IXOSC|nr:conserved hypothetical protein [Ixodes scapularis]|eukprot:XP_002408979.1 conserved hypothetical protein [Ixodes scapularis]